MHTKKIFSISLIIISVILLSSSILAQDTTKSLAFKNNRPFRNNPYFYQPDLSYQILQQFKLVQIANSGDPLAQHELGLRLLTGEGIASDTATAVYWIKKAASQNLTSAMYNYGIMLINGWGTDWNPFLAYDNFLRAAEAGMNQAQYVVGILHTDNLIVPRDWNKAYYWIKKADDGGYASAKEVLEELSPKVTAEFRDSVYQNKYTLIKDVFAADDKDDSKIQPSLGLVFIDFETQSDTIKEITDAMLISDLRNLNLNIVNESLLKEKDSSLTTFYDAVKLKSLVMLADAGSHEAETILGKLYESGKFVGLNKLFAAEYYIRATILDSPRAAYLLWKLIRENEFYTTLNDAVQVGDPSAQFVWYGLQKLGYDNRLNERDAIDLLQKASAQNHIPAIIELGFNYYTGKYGLDDKQKGLEYWELAEDFGSSEAAVRIAVAKVFGSFATNDLTHEFLLFEKSEQNGSVLAQFALGYCYENGLGVKKNLPTAVDYYRKSAQRGNQFAYEQLRRLYDNLRPPEKTFKVN